MLGGSNKDAAFNFDSDFDLWHDDLGDFQLLMDEEELKRILVGFPSSEDESPNIQTEDLASDKSKDKEPIQSNGPVDEETPAKQEALKEVVKETNAFDLLKKTPNLGQAEQTTPMPEKHSKHDDDKSPKSEPTVRRVTTHLKGKKIVLKLNLKTNNSKTDPNVNEELQSEVCRKEETVMPRFKSGGEEKDDFKPHAKLKKAAEQVKEYAIQTRSKVAGTLSNPKKEGYSAVVSDEEFDDDDELLSSEQLQSEEQEDMARTKKQAQQQVQQNKNDDDVDAKDEKKQRRRAYRRNYYNKKKQELEDLKQSVVDLGEEKKQLEENAQENEAKIEALEGELDFLKVQLASLKSKADTHERDKLTSIVNKLGETLRESQELIEQYYKPLCLQLHGKVNGLEQENLQLRMQNSEMSSKLRQAKITSIELGQKPILNVFDFKRAQPEDKQLEKEQEADVSKSKQVTLK